MNSDLFDPSLDILYNQTKRLDTLFHPNNIALIGASARKGSVGRTILINLLASKRKTCIFPVNPKRKKLLGVKTYPSISQVSSSIDLAIIATPAKTVPRIVKECIDNYVSSAIVISAGFKEFGKEGLALEKQISSLLKQSKMKLVGPNCLGIMRPPIGLNATFASQLAVKGKIAFISQSGALCTAVLDWSIKEKIGFSAFVSIGSMLDVDWGDLIDYFGHDSETDSILVYMENIGDARRFLSAAKEVALMKPIIIIKAGVSEESARAATSHTGALSASNDVLNAAFNRVGVLRVNSIGDLFSMAEILSKQPLPKGPHLAIITNAGGPGVIATDALVKNHGKLALLSDKTYQALNRILPDEWSHNNPIDILGDANPQILKKTLEVVAKDSYSDGILVILTPQYMTDPTKSAKAVSRFAHLKGKPILTSWMGALSVRKGIQLLHKNNIPNFAYPDDACRTFGYMWSYQHNLQGIYETPSDYKTGNEEEEEKRRKNISVFFNKIRQDGRRILTEDESKKILELSGIPIVQTFVAKNKKEAVEYAKKIGFPVVLKLSSKTITHKTDVGGVKLNLSDEIAVKKAFSDIYQQLKQFNKEKEFDGVSVQKMITKNGYELIIGSSVDPNFGPILLFGQGGQLVEVYKDRALSLPPITTTLARRMMEKTKIYLALKGVRGQKPVNLFELEKLLVRFSYLIAEFDEIEECDINPLLVSHKEMIAMDARIVLTEEGVKRPKLAIRPYPLDYVKKDCLKNGINTTFRPIRPEDETLIYQFLKDLSHRDMLQRFLKDFQYDVLLEKKSLIRFCCSDYAREITIVVELINDHKRKEVVAMGRLTKAFEENQAYFALIVKDKYQKQGIGKKLLHHLLHIAEKEKIKTVIAQMRKENTIMQKTCKNMGFHIQQNETTPHLMTARKTL